MSGEDGSAILAWVTKRGWWQNLSTAAEELSFTIAHA